jgi:hypothetical protein
MPNWKLDKNSRYIVRRLDGEPDVLFLWTPTLAQKKGFHPVTFEEAVLIKEADDKRIEAKKRQRVGMPADFQNPVVEDVAKSAEAIKTKDEAQKLAKTNEDLLKVELAKVEQFQTPDMLEEYFLLKYHIELLGDQELPEMKKEAVNNLVALSNSNKLYEV